MILKVAVCDDEQEGIDLLCKHLESFYFDTGIEIQKTIFLNPMDLLNSYQQPGTYDMVFLDVEMPINGEMINGIDIARNIRSLPDSNVKIIFVSNYPSYMQMGYDVHASYYLEKSASFEKFNRIMKGIIEDLQSDHSMYKIKTDRDEWTLLKIADILYVKSFPKKRETVSFHTHSREYVMTGRSILSVSEDLKSSGFVFANKYYLVNLRHVVRFYHDRLFLENNENIEISRHYQKSFHEQFNNHILKI